MLKRSLALAAGIALSLSAALAHAETLKELKVSAIPETRRPPSYCANSSRSAPIWRSNSACR